MAQLRLTCDIAQEILDEHSGIVNESLDFDANSKVYSLRMTPDLRRVIEFRLVRLSTKTLGDMVGDSDVSDYDLMVVIKRMRDKMSGSTLLRLLAANAVFQEMKVLAFR